MTDFNRRRFLEDSMFAAAAAVTAGAVGRSYAAEETKPDESSPINKLGVAVVGAGGRGGDHVNAFSSRPDTEILYICDADIRRAEGRAKEAAKKQGREPKIVQDMREVFDDKSVDIVSTATPNHWHALTSIWAMQAGKDVYVEKPVSHNVSEGRRMVEAARKYNRICQTGTQSRSNSGMKAMMDYLHSGKLGEVTLARGLCYKPRGSIGPRGDYSDRMPAHCNYDLWCGPAPMDPLTRKNLHYDWHWVWSTGNGDLGNQGIHQMDLCRWGLGVDDLGKSVVSYGGRLGYEDAGETANTQVSIHNYGDKTLVFEVRGLNTEPLKGAKVGNIFQGSKGYLVMTSYSGGAAFDLEGNMVEEFKGGGDHYGNFIDAVRSRRVEDLNGDILEGHLSSALCHLANISYRLGEQVSVDEARARLGDSAEAHETFGRFVQHLNDNKVELAGTPLTFGIKLDLKPDAEEFVNNSQANAMLTREYRAPFVVPSAGQV